MTEKWIDYDPLIDDPMTDVEHLQFEVERLQAEVAELKDALTAGINDIQEALEQKLARDELNSVADALEERVITELGDRIDGVRALIIKGLNYQAWFVLLITVFLLWHFS